MYMPVVVFISSGYYYYFYYYLKPFKTNCIMPYVYQYALMTALNFSAYTFNICSGETSILNDCGPLAPPMSEFI